ncbi:HNH endonuclease [Neolewinella sp.]|uniref:HNH endonuclease n=1 Tax=Neolewinella sp. TaxID=2993543 RepID=UPI003B52E27B
MASNKVHYITNSLRRKVFEYSKYSCRYCLLPDLVLPGVLQVDHIIPKKQQGTTDEKNLIGCCARCNLLKGVSIAVYFPGDGEIHPLYRPRKNEWSHHFRLEDNGTIHSKTLIGEGTIRLLSLNQDNRVETRKILTEHGYKFNLA